MKLYTSSAGLQKSLSLDRDDKKQASPKDCHGNRAFNESHLHHQTLIHLTQYQLLSVLQQPIAQTTSFQKTTKKFKIHF